MVTTIETPFKSNNKVYILTFWYTGMEEKTKITTIKLNRSTKERLDGLKEYRRESYEELIEKILEILNICKISPMRARAKLMKIDRQHKEVARRFGTEEEI